MTWLLRLLQAAGARAARLDPVDILNQQTGDDLLSILKELIP